MQAVVFAWQISLSSRVRIIGIMTEPFKSQIQTEVAAWLRWQLMSDSTLKNRFVGEQCGVCQDSAWKVQQKNLQ